MLFGEPLAENKPVKCKTMLQSVTEFPFAKQCKCTISHVYHFKGLFDCLWIFL